MRRQLHSTNRARVLATACAVASVLSVASPLVTYARADAAPNTWIRQIASGPIGVSPAIANFRVHTVLFSSSPRQGFTSYTAFGTVQTPSGPQLAISEGTQGGAQWTAPMMAVIADSSGSSQSPPFYLDDRFFGVADTGNYLEIFYRPYNADTRSFTWRGAFSTNGTSWTTGQSFVANPSQDTANKIVAGAACGSWNCESLGPTQIINNGSATGDCPGLNPILGCSWTLLFDASDGLHHSIGLAYSSTGTSFSVWHTALLTSSSDAWDSCSVTDGHLQTVTTDSGPIWILYYSGTGSGSCDDGLANAPMSIGVATSTNGLDFARSSTGPATPASLFDAITANAPTQLWDAQTELSGAQPLPVLFSRTTSSSACSGCPGKQADTFLATTSGAPSSGAQVAFASPPPYSTKSDPSILAVAGETLPAQIDRKTISLVLDAGTSNAHSVPTSVTTSLLNAYLYPTLLISNSPGSLNLPVGQHVATLTLKDLTGQTTIATRSFVITPPQGTVTTIATSPGDPQVGYGVGIGEFDGTTKAAAGDFVTKMEALVTNPLGQTERIFSDTTVGFSVNQLAPGSWTWRWVAPSQDTFFALPGSYAISILGVDAAGTVESVSSTNSRNILVV